MNTSTFSRLLRFLDQISPPQKAFAHCDIPCGVYETDSAMWAAETVDKLVKKLRDLKAPKVDSAEYLEYLNTVSRAVAVKEEYAHICKEQILILWTDYFKPEHVAKIPNLHEMIWKATKQCSVVKRTVSQEEASKLKTMVHDIAHAFESVK